MTLAAVLTTVATSSFSSIVMIVIMFFLSCALVRRGKEMNSKEVAVFRNEPDEITLVVSQQANYVKGIFLAIFLLWTALTCSFLYILSETYYDSSAMKALMACVIGYIFIIVAYVNITRMRLEVTTKRIRGCRGFNRRFDMPISSINTISMSAFSGITIGTASGPFVFNMLKNQYELYSTINDLIMGYYDDDEEEDEHEDRRHYSNADELRKYKELLDIGAITEEEYNAKKKQLLDL